MQDIMLSISDDVATIIQEKVDSGEFADAAAFVEQSVSDSTACDLDFDRRLQAEVLPGIAEWAADPSAEIQIDDILPRLRARHGRPAQS